MRITGVVQATRRKIRTTPEVNLLPPLALYRTILRAHRDLPPEARVLGDEYVKAEFRLHRNIENPAHIIGFLTSWQHYLECLAGDKWRLQKLDMEKISSLDDQQIIQVSKAVPLLVFSSDLSSPSVTLSKRARTCYQKDGSNKGILTFVCLLPGGKPPRPPRKKAVQRTCWWVIGLPGGSSPRPPFFRFARRTVVGKAPSLLSS
jgi:hypothetical protein